MGGGVQGANRLTGDLLTSCLKGGAGRLEWGLKASRVVGHKKVS